MKRVAVKIAYLGAGFNGSQRQPCLHTVESEIIGDICEVLRIRPDSVELCMAGRTDKGVNALGNVAVFNTGFEDVPTLVKALNSKSRRIFYRGYALVGEDFNPRFAELRIYEYVFPRKGMDPGLVRACCELFVGEHDFKRFCRPDGKPTVATVDSVSVEERGRNLVLTFKARYFLWNMIRRIAAAVMTVGSGSATLDDVRDALEGREINFGLARADALTLVDTLYPDLEFVPAERKPCAQRVGGERFNLDLRDRFYTSLEDDDRDDRIG